MTALPVPVAPYALLTPEERSAIAEIEATTNILKLVASVTKMQFATIAKFTESEWITCSVFDPLQLGIAQGDVFDLETTICGEFRSDLQALLIPTISTDGRYSSRMLVKHLSIESYAGVPIRLPDGRLYGALCALDRRSVLFENPELEEILLLFARLIGCIFFANLGPEGINEKGAPSIDEASQSWSTTK